jgi:hypothetical protein
MNEKCKHRIWKLCTLKISVQFCSCFSAAPEASFSTQWICWWMYWHLLHASYSRTASTPGVISISGTCLYTVQWLRTLIHSSIWVSYKVGAKVSRPIWSSHAHTKLHRNWFSDYKGEASGLTYKPPFSSPSCTYCKNAWKLKPLYCEFVLDW